MGFSVRKRKKQKKIYEEKKKKEERNENGSKTSWTHRRGQLWIRILRLRTLQLLAQLQIVQFMDEQTDKLCKFISGYKVIVRRI